MPAHKPLIFDGGMGYTRCRLPNFLDIEHLNVGAMEVVEINNGTITPAKTHTGAVAGTTPPTNQVHTVNGGSEGSIIVLRCQAAIVVDNTGNLKLRSSFTMDSPNDVLVLMKIQNGDWIELARSNND